MEKYNRYGLIAIKTLEAHKKEDSLRGTWNSVASELFESESSQKKACPRSTFLGLCEEGIVKGISKGDYNSNSTINKNHAIDAVKFLKENNIDVIYPKELWNELNFGNKSHNSQMDVVLALWDNKLLV